MKTDRIIALVLVGLCFLSVLAGLFFQRDLKSANRQDYDKQLFSWNKPGFGIGTGDIAVIDITGPIMFGSEGGFNPSNVDANQVISNLEQIKKDKMKGLLLRLNSPGGTASASAAIYKKIISVKKSTNLKVYAIMEDVAASGAYYIASSSDVIYSHPTTMTGSIGVIMQLPNYSELGNKIGYKTNTIKSGKFKDIGNGARNMTDDEKKLLQDMINDTYQEFVNDVSAGRKLPVERVKQLADGRIYTGNQAKANKLVDEVGTEEDAVNALAKVLRIEGEPKLKNYSRPSWQAIFSGLGSKLPFSSGLDTFLDSPEFNQKFFGIPLMLYR
jgi:protease-4